MCGKCLSYFFPSFKASSHEQIKMTEFWLEYDRKILHRRTLTLQHDRKIYIFNVEFDQTMTTTNIKVE